MARNLPFQAAGVCIDCAEPHWRERGSWRCFPCDRALARVRYECGRVVLKAIRAGAILPAKALSCVDCGSPARDYDHRNYLRPLEIAPVCRTCNQRRGPAEWKAEPECDKYRVPAAREQTAPIEPTAAAAGA